MAAASLPVNESERLAALRSYEVLDTACETAFDNIAELTAQVTGCPISAVSLTDAARQWFKARCGTEAPGMPREHSFCAHAILDPGLTMVVPDLRNDLRFADNPFVVGAPNVRFYAGAPLVNPEGAALGALCVLDFEPRTMSGDQQRIMARLAETVMTTLELRRAVNTVRRLAMVDMLTGLPNRTALIDALDRAIARSRRQGEGFGLLYLDLDGFKQVNDSRGHGVGDAVLCEMAATLTATLRREDMAARLGGDEFAVLLAGADLDVETAAVRVRSAVESAMASRGWAVTASIGATTFRTPPKDVDEALSVTDALMYGAKTAGKNRMAHRHFAPVERPWDETPDRQSVGTPSIRDTPAVIAHTIRSGLLGRSDHGAAG